MSEAQIWDTLRDYFKNNGLVKHQIDSFNYFISDGIQRVITEEPDIIVKRDNQVYSIQFGQVYITNPAKIEEDRTLNKITPSDTRNRDLTYDSPIFVDIIETLKEDGILIEKTIHKRIMIARTPIMLRSNLCNLKDLNPTELIKAGECEYDQGGYFIIKGKERVIVGQLRGIYNKILVLPQKSHTKYKYIAEIRSMSEETGHSVLVQAKIGNNDKLIVFSIPYIKEDIPIGIIFKAMGFIDDKQIINFIGLEGEKFDKYIKFIIRDSYFVESQEDALNYIGQFSVHLIRENERRNYAWQAVDNEIFPHMGIHATLTEKAYFLGSMINKLLSTNVGHRTEDDRDNYKYKRIEMTGVLCCDLFRTLFKRYTKTLTQQLEKKKYGYDIITMISRNNTITLGLRSSFATGNWGVQKNSYIRVGVSQVMSRLSYGGTLSHLRRLVIPIGKEGKNVKIRQIHQSQIMFICPAEVPEGQSAGIVLNIALLTLVTQRQSTVMVKEIIEDCEQLIPTNDYIGKNILAKVFLNGILLGFAKDPDEFVAEIKSMRRTSILDRQTSVTYDEIDNEIIIYCDEGRLIRPLFTVEDDKLKLCNTKETCWSELVEKNYIEYLDSSEIENYVLAMDPTDLTKYSCNYCEIHPSMMLGVMAAIIPFPANTQAPRVVYQASMSKQALGIYATSYQNRTDTSAHVMDMPQKPIVNTIPADIMGFNEMPGGVNAIVAITTCGGYNQEDSIVMNQSSVERGMFSVTSLRTLVCTEKKMSTSNISETICFPNTDIRRKDLCYGLLNTNGIIKKGVPVKKGDVIVGKIVTKTSKTGEEEITDCSLVVRGNEDEGIVDKVHDYTTPDGYRIIKIVVRKQKIPEIGDKFASRAAQKGTIGLLLRQEDMPFTQDGMVPDIIMNPQAIPSRMTINNLLEGVLGKSCAIEGKYGDATPWTSKTMDISTEICDRLEKNGFERHGWETMYSGLTGEPFTSLVYIGPVYYQRLKHMVSDKVHCLDIEKTSVLTLNGWKTAYELTMDDEIATLVDGAVVYEKPKNIMIYPDYQGNMYRVKNEDIDLYVSENHRMWVSADGGNYDFVKVQEMGENVMYKKDAEWNVPDMKLNVLMNGGEKKTLWNIGHHYGYLNWVDNIKEEDNDIVLPKWVFELSKRQCKIFLDGIIYDCESEEKKGVYVVEGKMKFLDQIQQLVLHCGWFSTIRMSDICNIITISKERMCETSKNPVKIKENVKCPVFCLEVPSEVFYVRRNGKTAWTGNSRSTGLVTTLTRQPLKIQEVIGNIKNYLVQFILGKMAYNFGKSLKAHTTTFIREIFCNTKGNDLWHRNNVWDWVIRG